MFKYFSILFLSISFYNTSFSSSLQKNLEVEEVDNPVHDFTNLQMSYLENRGDLMKLPQKQLREFLQKHCQTLLTDQKRNYKADSIYFFLPTSLSNSLSNSKVLEIGCSVGSSVRAFGLAQSVSIVEPNIDALSLAFDHRWTETTDKEQKTYLTSHIEACRQMKLDSSWLKNIENKPWISDEVTIYPCAVQSLPIDLNDQFDLICYKDFDLLPFQ